MWQQVILIARANGPLYVRVRWLEPFDFNGFRVLISVICLMIARWRLHDLEIISVQINKRWNHFRCWKQDDFELTCFTLKIGRRNVIRIPLSSESLFSLGWLIVFLRNNFRLGSYCSNSKCKQMIYTSSFVSCGGAKALFFFYDDCLGKFTDSLQLFKMSYSPTRSLYCKNLFFFD